MDEGIIMDEEEIGEEKRDKVRIVTTEDGGYLVLGAEVESGQELGEKRSIVLEEGKLPSQKDWNKFVRNTKRAFIALSLAAVVGVYTSFLAEPLKHLGKAANGGAEVAYSLKNFSGNVLRLIEDKKALEEELEIIDPDNEISQEVKQRFREAYQQQQSLVESARGISIQYQSFSREVNEFARVETPVGELEGTMYHGLAQEIYNKAQVLITGRDTSNAKYINDFNKVRTKQKELADAVRGLEGAVNTAIEEDDLKEAGELIDKYIRLVGAQQEYVRKVKDQGIGKLVGKDLEEIDEKLRGELGDDYLSAAGSYERDGVDYEKALPIAGGILLIVLSYLWPIRPLAKYVAEPAAKLVAGAGRRKSLMTRKSFLENLSLKYILSNGGKK